MAEQNSIRWRDRYYAARPAATARVSSVLADAVSAIDSPVIKLRFLRDVIDHQRPIPHAFRYRIIRPLGRLFIRFVSFTGQFARTTQHKIHTWFGRGLLIAVCGCTAIFVTTRLTDMEKLLNKRATAINAQATIIARALCRI